MQNAGSTRLNLQEKGAGSSKRLHGYSANSHRPWGQKPSRPFASSAFADLGRPGAVHTYAPHRPKSGLLGMQKCKTLDASPYLDHPPPRPVQGRCRRTGSLGSERPAELLAAAQQQR